MHISPNIPSDSNEPVIKYYGDILTINGNIVPYLQQVAYSSDRLMISDLGLQISFNSQLRAFDEQLFKSLFQQQLFHELESSHISIGLNILSNMPEILIGYYQYVLGRLSMDKINDMLKDNAFFSLIASSIAKMVFGNSYQNSVIAVSEQSQAFIRALNLLYLLEGSGAKLQTVLHQIASKLVQRKYNELKQNCSINNHRVDDRRGERYFLNQKEGQLSFLQMMMKISISFRYLKQLKIQDTIDGQRIVEQKVYDKDFLIFLSNNFKEYFENGREDLLITLCMISNDCKYSIWENVICPIKENRENLFSRQQKSQQTISNQRSNQFLLKELFFDYYLGFDCKNWGNCIFLLQNLIRKDHNDSLDRFITDIVIGINYPQIKIQLIDLACFHMQRLVAHRKVETQEFKQFLSSFLLKICCKIDQQYFKFCRLNKKKSKKLYGKLFSVSRFIIFPKVNSVWIAAILRTFTLIIQLRLIDVLDSFNFQTNIQRLVKMSRNGKGLTYGSLRAFAKAVNRQSSINSYKQKDGYLLPKEESRIQSLRQLLIQEIIL